MAKIHNSDLTKELVNGAKIQQSFDKVPNEIAEKVVPVMEVNPRLLKTINIVKAGSGASTTLYTTPADRDFYLVATSMCWESNAAAAAISGNITATLFGDTSATILNEILGRTTVAITADSGSSNISYPFPIKLARGTAITLSATNCTTDVGIIFGYIDDVSRA